MDPRAGRLILRVVRRSSHKKSGDWCLIVSRFDEEKCVFAIRIASLTRNQSGLCFLQTSHFPCFGSVKTKNGGIYGLCRLTAG